MNDGNSAPDLGPGAEGEPVLRAQILLARSHFSPGEINTKFGPTATKAVRAFQAARGLPQTGTVDAATWKALNADQAPAVILYALTDHDEAGPFGKIPRDMIAKAKLKRLGYSSPSEALGERFHVNPGVLQRLNPGKSLRKPGTEIVVPNVLVSPPLEASQIVVNGTEGSVTAFDAAGKLLAWYAATTGSEHDPLPVGNWKILGKSFSPKFHYNPDLFWDATGAQSKATIAPGPNNPVGMVWIDLSKKHYGIHGTPEPSEVGTSTSHGCIRLTNWDAVELAHMVKPGTPAILKVDTPRPQVQPPPRPQAQAPRGHDEETAAPGRLIMPVAGVDKSAVRDTFNEGRDGHRHEATDILAPRGTPVLAAVNGTVKKLFHSEQGGLTVYEFDRSEKYCYYYAHLDRYADGLTEGMPLAAGQVIGYVGTTGNAPHNTPHLHFAIFKLGSEKQWWRGTAINPYPVLLASR
ncbi:MAG TPA: L,D-transpeptidase family protein [Bryobacteraceae bacterium]|nr:L,D-transpeptidase family protein [Bryobacteraceae bacterium]